jgi:hypothetical protein
MLDARHSRALAAGATEVVAPHDRQGMPRNSAVRDLSGNGFTGLTLGSVSQAMIHHALPGPHRPPTSTES